MSPVDDPTCPWRVPASVRVVQLILVSLVAVYVASLLARDTAGYSLAFEGVIAGLALGLTGVLCLLRAVLRREDRAPFALIGFGCLMYTAGNIAYVSHVPYLDPVPFPNVADIGWLGIYPFLVVAVILLGRSEVAGTQVGVWLDGAVGVLGVATAGSALVLHTTLENLSGDLAACSSERPTR